MGEKKSKDKKKDENSGKKSKNWRMKKKGERDDKQDGLDDAEEEPMVVVPTGAKIEDVVEAVPEKVVEPVSVPSVEVKQPKKEKLFLSLKKLLMWKLLLLLRKRWKRKLLLKR